jgi:hypothetical protein
MEQLCSVPGCETPSRARGWCGMHYQRWRNHGDPGWEAYGDASKPWGSRRDVCEVGGCSEPHKSHGYCVMHLARWLKHGDPLYVRDRPQTCSVNGCESKPYSRGWCGLHYHRWRTHGDPTRDDTPRSVVELSSQRWQIEADILSGRYTYGEIGFRYGIRRGTVASYAQKHLGFRRQQGKPCTVCALSNVDEVDDVLRSRPHGKSMTGAAWKKHPLNHQAIADRFGVPITFIKHHHQNMDAHQRNRMLIAAHRLAAVQEWAT